MADLLRQTPVDYELIKNNRFELIFPTDLGFESWMVQSCDRPKFTVNSVEIPYMNTKYYTTGQFSWGEMKIEMINTFGPSTTQKSMEWLRLNSESLSGRQGYAKGHMKNLVLHALDPTGAPVEEWVLVNCMITAIDFGTFDYSDDKVTTVSMTVQPQKCINTY